MSITIEFDKTIARIILSGDIDYSTQDEIREQNNIAIGAAQVTEIHVDLGAVTFIDSSGIRALLMLQKKAAAGKKTTAAIRSAKYLRSAASMKRLRSANMDPLVIRLNLLFSGRFFICNSLRNSKVCAI